MTRKLNPAKIRPAHPRPLPPAAAPCPPPPGRKPLAGGLPIESPLGTIYSTNITSSQRYGIGRYSLQQFSEALRRRLRARGAHLYPAMPYASYALLTDEDVKALYAYFTKSVPAIDQ